MVPMTSSSSKLVEKEVPIEEIIFSCSICQATVSEIYATTESNQGFYSGSGDEDGIVTKLWITECSHVTCAKHLQNGAAPFHPKGMAPKAPCPKCLKEKGDDTPRNLYGIRGLDEGEYDDTIPSEWRQCPAIKLDSSIPGISAVRFQYMALVHYSLQARKYWKSAEKKQLTIEAACSKERKQRRQLQTELQGLQDRVKTLEKRDEELKKWEQRKPMISHYLGAFESMSRQMEAMRTQLLDFGVAVPEVKYSFRPPRTSAQDTLPPTQSGLVTAQQSQPNGAAAASIPYGQEGSSSARKRKREDQEAEGIAREKARQQRSSVASRDLMPPPLPKPRQVELRVDARTTVPTPAVRRPPSSQQPIHVYEDRNRNLNQGDPFYKQQLAGRGSSQSQTSIQSRTTLPFRPPLVRSHESQDSLRGFSSQIANLKEARTSYCKPVANDHYTQQPKHFHSEIKGYRELMASERSMAPRHVHNQSPFYNPSARPRAQQQDQAMRPPLLDLSKFDYNRRLPVTARMHVPEATPLRQNSPRPRPSELSPFFRRDDRGMRPFPNQRPPITGSFVQPVPHDNPIHDRGVNEYSATLRYAQNGHNQSQISTGPSSLNNVPSRANLAPSHSLTHRRLGTATHYQPRTAVPQTPRNSQGLFHRPDRPQPCEAPTAIRPQANTNRSRVSLPPNYGPQMPMASTQDEALLQVPGIRGVGSQRGASSYRNTSPAAYTTAKNLFSSAGGRRSVLR